MKLPWYRCWAQYAASRGNSRMIYDRESNEEYLERFYIHPRWLTLGLFRVVIHCFHASDKEEDGLHDHPWYFWCTRILEGSYIEVLENGVKLRTAGDWRFGRKKTLHRVHLFKGVHGEEDKVWTLFIMGPRLKSKWGFIINGKWIESEEYIAQKSAKHYERMKKAADYKTNIDQLTREGKLKQLKPK